MKSKKTHKKQQNSFVHYYKRCSGLKMTGFHAVFTALAEAGISFVTPIDTTLA